MEEGVPVPGFISNLKYLPAHKNWDGSFIWLTQFVRANAQTLANAKLFGAIATTIFAGIMMFGNREEDEGDYEDDDDD